MGTGESAARDLGQGWKISPSIRVEPGQTLTLADISGAGAIQHIWMTPTGDWRLSILRMYWDGERIPLLKFRLATSSPWAGTSTRLSRLSQSV